MPLPGQWRTCGLLPLYLLSPFSLSVLTGTPFPCYPSFRGLILQAVFCSSPHSRWVGTISRRGVDGCKVQRQLSPKKLLLPVFLLPFVQSLKVDNEPMVEHSSCVKLEGKWMVHVQIEVIISPVPPSSLVTWGFSERKDAFWNIKYCAIVFVFVFQYSASKLFQVEEGRFRNIGFIIYTHMPIHKDYQDLLSDHKQLCEPL